MATNRQMMSIGIIECLMESRSDQIRSDVVSEIEKRRSWWMVELWEGRVCQSTVSLDSLDSTRTQVACDVWGFFRADVTSLSIVVVVWVATPKLVSTKTHAP